MDCLNDINYTHIPLTFGDYFFKRIMKLKALNKIIAMEYYMLYFIF